ncbi:MAG: type II toxin-antitoxin system VapC family toxin [Candidatus Hydromicrobium sp.]|nr:type II toxin-antitoxin system VapC family toxin [Candidatus Hydromicrobium sp.]
MGLKRLESLETAEEEIFHRIREQPRTLVLDSSVFIKWFSKDEEDDMSDAISILKSLTSSDIIIVCPEIAIYELANVLYYKPDLDYEKTKIALEQFLNLGIEFIKLFKSLILDANKIRHEFDITFYDSSYLAVARFFKLKFITADKKLYESCREFENIELLKNFSF